MSGAFQVLTLLSSSRLNPLIIHLSAAFGFILSVVLSDQNTVFSVQLFWPQEVTHMGSKKQTRSLMPAGSPTSTNQTLMLGSLKKVY